MPGQDADAGSGSPPRDAGSRFRSAGHAAGPRPTLTGRSTLRSLFTSVTLSVQWEDARLQRGGPEAPTRSYRQPESVDTLPNCPQTLPPLPTAPQPLRRSPRAGTCLRARWRTRTSLPRPTSRPRAPIGRPRRHSVWEAIAIDQGPGARPGGGRGPGCV